MCIARGTAGTDATWCGGLASGAHAGAPREPFVLFWLFKGVLVYLTSAHIEAALDEAQRKSDDARGGAVPADDPPCLGDTVSRCIPIMLGKEAPTFMPIDAFDCDHGEGAVTVVVTDRTDVLQKGANKQHVIRVPLVRDSKGPEYQAISTFLQSDLLVDVPGRVVEFCLARTTEVFVLCEDETGHRSIYEIPRKEETAYSAPSA